MKKILRILPFLALIILSISVLDLFKIRIKPSELPNLLGIAIGVAGLLPAWWSTKIAAESAEDAKENAWQTKIDYIEKQSEERDRHHDNELALIKQELAAIATQFEYQQNSYNGLITQMFGIKDEFSKISAQLAVATRLGEITLRLDKVQSEIRDLRSKD